MNKTELLLNLKHARDFIGQAQSNAPRLSELWKELGQKYDDLDSLIESVGEGDYD